MNVGGEMPEMSVASVGANFHFEIFLVVDVRWRNKTKPAVALNVVGVERKEKSVSIVSLGKIKPNVLNVKDIF